MERDEEGRPFTSSVATAERDADRLAFELIAPAEHVLGQVYENREALSRTLRGFYGLPAAQAHEYAELLVPPVKTDPLILRLRASVT
jgi:hypothetical protein